MVKSKISRTTGFLFKLNNFLPTNVLLTIYQSLLHPYFTHGIEFWHPFSLITYEPFNRILEIF